MPLYVDKNTAIPWGRNFDEYRRMFALSDADLASRILGCSDGPASVNAEVTAAGGRIVSVDPLFAVKSEHIEARVGVARDMVMTDTYKSLNDYKWDVISSPEELETRRLKAVRDFLADFRQGGQSRYVCSALPSLPFEERSFDLALCSHFLFLYSEQFDFEFHLAAVEELLRVASELRVFPLLDLKSRRSAHLAPLLDHLEASVWNATVERVPYEFQIGAFEMLRIR